MQDSSPLLSPNGVFWSSQSGLCVLMNKSVRLPCSPCCHCGFCRLLGLPKQPWLSWPGCCLLSTAVSPVCSIWLLTPKKAVVIYLCWRAPSRSLITLQWKTPKQCYCESSATIVIMFLCCWPQCLIGFVVINVVFLENCSFSFFLDPSFLPRLVAAGPGSEMSRRQPTVFRITSHSRAHSFSRSSFAMISLPRPTSWEDRPSWTLSFSHISMWISRDSWCALFLNFFFYFSSFKGASVFFLLRGWIW